METQALKNLYSAYIAMPMVKQLPVLDLQCNKQKTSAWRE